MQTSHADEFVTRLFLLVMAGVAAVIVAMVAAPLL